MMILRFAVLSLLTLPLAAPVMAQPPAAEQKADLPDCLKPSPLLASATLPVEKKAPAVDDLSTGDPCTYRLPTIRGLW